MNFVSASAAAPSECCGFLFYYVAFSSTQNQTANCYLFHNLLSDERKNYLEMLWKDRSILCIIKYIDMKSVSTNQFSMNPSIPDLITALLPRFMQGTARGQARRR